MSRFLLAWELGGGLGHISHLVPVARALRARGHYAALALRDLRVLSAVGLEPEMPVYQAPLCIHSYDGLAEPPLNYAEVLMRFGYLDAGMLVGLVRGWRDLAHAMRADVIVADHAPSAILAAKSLDLPCTVIGNAFTVPPAVSPTPNMRPWLKVPPERLATSDRSVVENINRCLATFGKPALANLHQLFDVADIAVTNFLELDHYPQRPAGDLGRVVFHGPLPSAVPGTVRPAWPLPSRHDQDQRIFAYLKPGYKHLAATLGALADCGRPCVIYGLGTGSADAPAHAANLAFSPQPIDVTLAAGECSFAICHAGGVTATLLAAGRALLLLPTQLEQFLEGVRVTELGAGLVINPEDQQPDIKGALTRLLDDGQLTAGARRFAERYRDWSADRILDNIVTRLASVAAASRPNLAGIES